MKNLFTILFITASLSLTSLNLVASQLESKATAAAVLAAAESKQTSEKLVTRAQKLKPLLYDTLTTLPQELIEMIVSYDYLFEGKEVLCRVNHEKQTATAMAFISPHFIAIGDNEGRIKIWNSKTGTYIKTLERTFQTSLGTFTNNGSVRKIKQLPATNILVSHNFNNFYFWNIESGKCIETIWGSEENLEEEDMEEEDMLAKIHGKQNILKLLHFLYPTLGKPLTEYRPSKYELLIDGGKIAPLAIRYDTSLDAMERRRKSQALKIGYVLVQAAKINCITLVPCDHLSKENLIYHELCGHAKEIAALAQLPNGLLASGSLDRTIRIWDLETGKCLLIIQTMQPVEYLDVTDDGKLIAGFQHGSFQVFA